MPAKRKELFSEKVLPGKRSYFFDIKEAENGAKYLVISESKRSGERYRRNRVLVFEEDISAFYDGFNKAAAQLRRLGRARRGASGSL